LGWVGVEKLGEMEGARAIGGGDEPARDPGLRVMGATYFQTRTKNPPPVRECLVAADQRSELRRYTSGKSDSEGKME